MRREPLAHLLAALLYVLPALWALRDVLPDPRALVPVRAGTQYARIDRTDQRFVVGTTIATTRRLASQPTRVLADGACYPLPKPFTLGEHMLGESLLALGPWLASRDPVLAYNAMLALSWWIAAVAMYALALFWTRDAGAAFVAGLLFGFQPARLGDPGHPFVVANLWLPLVLLLLHLTVARGRWRHALALAAVASLQLAESLYRVLGATIVAGTYGLHLARRYRATLLARAPQLALVAGVLLTVGWTIFGPYLEMRAASGVLRGRAPAMLFPYEYLPGGPAWLGWTALALAALGIADRLRGPRPRDGDDPRLTLLLAGLLLVWCSLWPVRLPLVGVELPSPLLALSGVIPGLDAVRALRLVWFDVTLVVALLAAYGVALAGERVRHGAARAALVAILAVAALLEVFASPSTSLRLAPFAVGPSDEQRALYARIDDDGAVLDLPLRYDLRGGLHDMAYYLFLRAYHGRPAAACYNSFSTPLQQEIAAIAARLPDPAAADELHAHGFRWLVVHDELLRPGEAHSLTPLVEDPTRTELRARARHAPTFTRRGQDPGTLYEQRLYRLSRPAPAPDATTTATPPGS